MQANGKGEISLYERLIWLECAIWTPRSRGWRWEEIGRL